MIAHDMDMLKKDPNMRTICVQTADSDVIVSLTSYMATFKAESQDLELCVNFGMGKFKRWVSINAIYETLGESVSESLSFFHASTGCDSTTAF